MALVLGAALGPRAIHVDVRDAATGRLVSSGSARHRDAGGDMSDPATWWRSLASAVAATGQREIAAMAISGGHPGLVLLDGAGAVLQPRPSWSEGDASADADRLRRALGADGWVRSIGAVPGPGTAVTRLAWLRRRDPEAFARIGAALLPHDWLTYRLSGRAVTDRGSASLTGVWSPRDSGWLDEVLDLLAPRRETQRWRERLPEVVGPQAPADWLTAPMYELLGLRGRPLVGPGTGEPMAVALALRLQPGRVGLSLGATTTVLGGLARPVSDPSGEVRSRADATGAHLAIATAPGGSSVVTAVSDLLGVDVPAVSALAEGAVRGPADLLVLPGVPGRRGAIVTGLVPGSGRAGLARAAFDGGACAALDVLDRSVTAGATWDDDEPLRLAAPATTRAVHAQTLADLSGRPVQPAPEASLAAAGACIQAAAVLDGADPAQVAEAWSLDGDEWFEPDALADRYERRAAHTAEQARQQQAAANP